MSAIARSRMSSPMKRSWSWQVEIIADDFNPDCGRGRPTCDDRPPTSLRAAPPSLASSLRHVLQGNTIATSKGPNLAPQRPVQTEHDFPLDRKRHTAIEGF